MDKEFQKAKTYFLKEWWEIVGVLEDIKEVDGTHEVYIRCHGFCTGLFSLKTI